MKRKCLAMVLVVLLVAPGFVHAERWAKGFDFTFQKFVEAYNSAPAKVYGEIVPLYFVELGPTEYRNYYYAEVKPLIEVIVVAEDNTDKVVNIVITIKMDDSVPYNEQVKAGGDFVHIISAATFAAGSGKHRYPMTVLEEEFGFPNELLFENNLMEYDDDGLTYAFNYQDKTIWLSIRLTEIYESKEDYLAYRQTTLPKK